MSASYFANGVRTLWENAERFLMGANFIPSREADLVAFCANFSALITATPTAFGLVAGQATTYATLNTAFVTSYNLIKNNTTRSPANIIAKNQAKRNLIANTRLLAGVIQKYPAITNAQRSSLGLTVPNMPSPIPAPSTAPQLEIGVVTGYTVKVRLHDSASGSKRGKPAGVSGASVFSHVGATAPSDLSVWKFEGNTSKTAVEVLFPNTTAAGATVWLTAFWFNPRKQSGPACAPVSTNVQGGSVSLAA